MATIISIHWSLFFLILSVSLSQCPGAPIGINYGQIADNLLPPEKVATLLKSIGISKVKLYDADPLVLSAFSNTAISFTISLSNQCITTMINPSKALAWLKSNLQPHLPSTTITSITIGNEVLTSNNTALIQTLLPAMQNVHTALQTLNLDTQIKVTTAHSLAVLQSSFPPSHGVFRRDLSEFMPGILDFLCKTGSPFLINAYPYFAYKEGSDRIDLDYVLFEKNEGVIDPVTKLRYDNMLFAQIDAVHSALAAEGFGNLKVQVSETGWPSKGDGDEIGANLENARKYNGNLLDLLSKKKGTPLRPHEELDVYVFALFNENLKPGPTSERNYGLFNPDGTPVYKISIGGSGESSGEGSGTPVVAGEGNATTVPGSSSPALDLNFSSAKELRSGGDGVCWVLLMCLIWVLELL